MQPARAPCSIAEVLEGSVVSVEGVVRAIEPPLRAPLGGEPCVYYEVRDGLLGQHSVTGDRAAQNFMLDDDSGSALVVMERCEVTLVATMREQMLPMSGAIGQVAQRLRQLKQALRSASTNDAPALRQQRDRLRDLATYLCTASADAREHVHHPRHTLATQRRWLAQQRARFDARSDADAPRMPVRAWEIALEPGQRVTVEGFARWEPDPDPRASGSYRQRPLRLCLRAPTDAPLRVWTVDAQLQRSLGRLVEAQTDARLGLVVGRTRSPKRSRRWVWLVIAAAAATGVMSWLLRV